jgi:general stress protein YciG
VSDETKAAHKPRGFAAMDRAAVRKISQLGGVAAHQQGTAHEFTTEEAREAGRKGGRAMHAKRRTAAVKDSATPNGESK